MAYSAEENKKRNLELSGNFLGATHFLDTVEVGGLSKDTVKQIKSLAVRDQDYKETMARLARAGIAQYATLILKSPDQIKPEYWGKCMSDFQQLLGQTDTQDNASSLSLKLKSRLNNAL